MSYSNYSALINELCRMTNLGVADELDAPMFLTVEGVEFALAPGGEEHPHALAVLCNFGAPTDAWPLPVILKRLLEANLALFPPGGLRFGINPMKNEVILSGIFPLHALTAPALLRMLHGCAQHALEWREHFFLHKQPPTTTSSSSSRRRSLMEGELR